MDLRGRRHEKVAMMDEMIAWHGLPEVPGGPEPVEWLQKEDDRERVEAQEL